MTKETFNKSTLAKADKLVKAIREILFSNTTYQLDVVEGKQHFWPLLQINDEGDLQDAICSCGESQKGLCAHSLAAYKKVVDAQKRPLHVRFKASLWYQIAEICSRRHGYELNPKGLGKDSYKSESRAGRVLFELKAKTKMGKESFNRIFVNREKKDENNALEFSNRTPEEIRLWREGKPSHELAFDLSFWSDLAKWWMQLAETRPIQIRFLEGASSLPKALEVDLKEVEFYFSITEANWEVLIPTLRELPSPLKVFEREKEGKIALKYDETKQGFHVICHKDSKQEEGILVDSWVYIPKQGFYKKSVDPIFQKSFISKEEVCHLLDYHFSYVVQILEGVKVQKKPQNANYYLYFDEDQNLHIDLYLKTKKDLDEKNCALFDHWLYVPTKGFIPLENLLFKGIHNPISKEEVADFVTKNKVWLSQQKGFATHISSLEDLLTYRLETNGDLRFVRSLEMTPSLQDVIDFGSWVYVEERGFFLKRTSDATSILKPGLRVSSKEVASFILRYKDELHSVVDFFSKSCPVKEVALEVKLNDKERLNVNPLYGLQEGIAKEKMRYYGNVVYCEGMGFTELPAALQLPEGYQKEKSIPSYEVKHFLEQVLPELKCRVILDLRLIPLQNFSLVVGDMIKLENRGEYQLKLYYETEHGKLSLKDIWTAFKQNKHLAFTSTGLVDLSKERFAWITSLPEEAFTNPDYVHLTSLGWHKLKLYEEPTLSSEGFPDVKLTACFEQLQELSTQELLDLEGLKSELRGYQEIGVRWLFSLYTLGLSGLLGDDMGLGKTHQAMGLIAAVANAKGQQVYQFLIVCPTSVIYHWQAQLHRFLPDMPITIFYGLQRSEKEVQKKGVIITSYGILRSQQEIFAKRKFDIAIFDELQVAKNPGSKTHKVLKLIDASMRVGLSGTPIENRLEDLKALFDIILPQFLPKNEVFKEQFIIPIERDKDLTKANKLKAILKPFLLRRKKQDVLKELPEKVEEIAYCSLSEAQKKIYAMAVAKSKAFLIDEVSKARGEVSYVHVFALLTQLKRICDHPSLVTKDFSSSLDPSLSGKWELFIHLLEEARASGQKVVVFSQYLDMLDIIERYLKQNHIGFSAVRGSTVNRKEEIRRFQEDPSAHVFVASLQAVGVGIDLTAASVVIHYDRWWNPAKENQATDRVHRIGQNKNVQVFKMVTKGTIEERIHELIERKNALVKDILPHDDEEELRSFTKEELLTILQSLEESPQNFTEDLTL